MTFGTRRDAVSIEVEVLGVVKIMFVWWRTKLEGQLWVGVTRRWSLSFRPCRRKEWRYVDVVCEGRCQDRGGSETEQSKWWTVEHGMPRGARKWEMFEHRDFVNWDCILRLTPQERLKWCRKRAFGRKKSWDKRRLWSKRSRYEPEGAQSVKPPE